MSKLTDTTRGAIVERIVGRCHVGRSNLDVIRYVISRLKHGYKTWRALPREERREMLQHIVECHRDNRKLYVFVMGGVR